MTVEAARPGYVFETDMADGERQDGSAFARCVRGIASHDNSLWAWDNTKSSISALGSSVGARRALEIGGGRDPLYTPEEADALGFALTVNDISAEELRHAPQAFDKSRFDIAGDLGGTDAKPGSYDLAFSRMVFEHVNDGRRAWSNVHTLLAPGGVAFAFIPTLYALPFVVNKLIPEWASHALVKALYPHRTDTEDPKFPAHYSLTYASQRKMARELKAIGFSDVHVVPFWGHEYFAGIPGVRELDRQFSKLAARNRWATFAAYAYVIARK